MFEVGKLSDESIDSLLQELEKVSRLLLPYQVDLNSTKLLSLPLHFVVGINSKFPEMLFYLNLFVYYFYVTIYIYYCILCYIIIISSYQEIYYVLKKANLIRYFILNNL